MSIHMVYWGSNSLNRSAVLLVMIFAVLSARLCAAQEHTHDHAKMLRDAQAAAATAATNQPSPIQPRGTLAMIDLLRKAQADWNANPEHARFESDLLAEGYGLFVKRQTNAEERLSLQPQLGMYLLEAGRSQEALQVFDAFRQANIQQGRKLDRHNQSMLEICRALASLRIGEQENCISNHNPDSCLLPIAAGGVHQYPRGSRNAITILLELLAKFPTDLRARWLLTVASMTVGDYPDKVPAQWLIPPKAFASDYQLPRFPEVASRVGLDIDGLAGGCIVDDFDGDGYLDVMFSDWSLRGQIRFFHNNADGTFTERTKEALLTGITGGLNIVQTDYNNDGFLDVLVLRGAWNNVGGHHPMSLLKNRGDGTFEDVTIAAGLLHFKPTQAAVWFDYNGDGWLDLFVGCESTTGDTNPSELFRNNGDGTFTECAKEAGVDAIQFIKGVTAGDFNNDGRPDLYLATLTGPNMLFRNDGPAEPGGSPKSKWKFTNVAEQAHVTEPIRSFPCWFFDYDNDGWPDIFVSGYGIKDVGDIAADYLGMPNSGETARLYHNNRDGTFSDMSKAAGVAKVLLTMGSNFGDLDNDGWLDFYLGTGNPEFTTIVPNRMFRNAEGKFFQDVTTSGGFGHLQKGHGVAFADFNNDGQQDVFIKIGGAYTGDNYRSALFLNPGNTNHWLTLKLEGVTSNRAAIGARVKVVVDTAKGQRSIFRTVCSGGSFGANPLRQEIGLGDAQSIASVEVSWPRTGNTQVLRGLERNKFYKIREGDSSAVALNLKSFSIPLENATGSHHHHAHASANPPP